MYSLASVFVQRAQEQVQTNLGVAFVEVVAGVDFVLIALHIMTSPRFQVHGRRQILHVSF